MPAPQRFGAVQTQQPAEQPNRSGPEQRMRAPEAEVDQDDDRGDRQAVADDRERPRVAGVALVDEAADGARSR